MNKSLLKKIEMLIAEYVEFMTGGISKGKLDGIDPAALAEGIKVEMEHTSIERIAKKIAADHITEHSDYYKKLKEAGL